MKKLAIALVISSFSMSFATYQVVYPNQLVNFKFTGNPTSPETPEVPEIPEVPETFTPTDPLISEWTSINDPYDCGTYMPNTSSYAYGVVFTQNSDNCKMDQERTIQNRQISSITNAISNVGSPVVEKQTLNDQSNSKDATGTRYNYTMKVGSYNYGPTYYYGYFSDHYMSQFGAGFVTSTSGTMTPSTFRGSSIDHLVEQAGGITMRVLPDITGAMPVLTINGKPCTLIGPNVYTAYDALCNFNLGNFVGQTIYIDLQ